MRIIVLAAGALAAVSVPGSAQGDPATAPAATCYIQIQRLMGEPPEGIGDLGAAIRELDAALRPQVEEINRLKDELQALQQRQQRAMLEEEDNTDLATLEGEIRRLTGELDEKQGQLKLDYAAQQSAIVGPVQTRVSQKAQAFAIARGCGEIKMARTPDLAALQAAAARDVTGDFVGWYVLNKS